MDNLRENILRICNKIAVQEGFQPNYNVDVKQLTTDGKSYSSAVFRVTISEPNRELKLFGKAANINEDFRNSSYAKIFLDEYFFYNSLAKTFTKIQQDYEIEDEHRMLFPVFYGGDITFREETIVLEDLVDKGYVSHDQQLPYDWEYASKVVEQLAKFHALSFVYGLEDRAEFTKILDDLPYHIFDTDIMRSVAFDMTIPAALEAAEGENKTKLKSYLETNDRFEEMLQLYQEMPKRVIVHGDFKTNNVMHRRVDGKLEIMLVDFQIIHAGSPVTDLLYFIFLGSDEEFRKVHYQDLLEHYYAQLKAALSRMGVEVNQVFPREAFEKDLKAALPIALAISLMILPMLLVDPGDAMRLDEEVSPGSQGVSPNALFAERLNGVLNDFVQCGIL